MNTFTDLVLLIGTNPLPNYVSESFSYLDGRNFQIVDDVSGIITQRDLKARIREKRETVTV